MTRKILKQPINFCIKCKYLQKLFSLYSNEKCINFNRRYKWTQPEDQVLLFWKLGTMIIKQVKSHAFLSYGIKDVMRSVFGKVRFFFFC